jgi:RNA 2',3'-cyclic 3'-phosphodiesterase
MIRLFAALAVPEEIGAALQARQTGIEGARWRPLAALHVTLCFYGDVREDIARDLDAELMALRARPFEITLAGAGSFNEGVDIPAVWIGVADNPALNALATATAKAARRCGIALERRAYRPHVTLAYLKRPDPREVAGWIQAHNLARSPPIPIRTFGLYSSTLGSEGSRYNLEADYTLA